MKTGFALISMLSYSAGFVPHHSFSTTRTQSLQISKGSETKDVKSVQLLKNDRVSLLLKAVDVNDSTTSELIGDDSAYFSFEEQVRGNDTI